MSKSISNFLKKYNYASVFLYLPVYMTWFDYLEKSVRHNYYIMHSRFDDLIPFNEYFVVPYLLWFLYVALFLLYFFFKDKKEFLDCFTMLAAGMSICLFICWVFPNGTNLRPHIDPTKNWATYLVSLVYTADTSTNVFPSIHVYNSIAIHIAVRKSKFLTKCKFVQFFSFVLMLSICMSTVALKQHSVLDVIGSLVLASVMYIIIYINVPTGLGDTSDNELVAGKTGW